MTPSRPTAPPAAPPSGRRRAVAAAAAAAALTLAGALLAVPAVTAPAAAAPPAGRVTITPDPAVQGEAFQGWGTSLVWFANATGGYPDALKNQLRDLVFGDDGLNLNIARYNVGGGSATDVDTSYFRPGGAVPGWWNAAAPVTDADGTIAPTRDNRERYLAAWDASNPANYDATADAAQQWWVDAVKGDVDTWETFSNSPPWFMTENGYTSGGFDSSAEQIDPDAIGKFAEYMATVTEQLETTHGIDVGTIDPLNEPNTPYWGTYLDADGSLQNGRQEGAHVGPARQAAILRALADRLDAAGTTTDAGVSGPDETNPGTFVSDWYGWTAEARAAVDQLNVHTYGTSDRRRVRDIAKTADKPLWMSEVEGNWGGSGFNPTSMDNGLGLAQHITDDLRELDPNAWVFWQPVEDYWNMQRGEKQNWGSVYIDFDCDAQGNSARRLAAGDADPSCKIVVNSKYNTTRNFTHFITPGDHLIPTDDAQTTSAVKGDGSGAVLVHSNPTSGSRAVTIDLSKFGAIAPGATVTPVVTTESPAAAPTRNALRTGTPVAVNANGKAALVVPARSVTTFVVSGVSGVATAAVPLQDGVDYQLVGVGSGKALTVATGTGSPATTITTPATTSATAAAQTWTATRLDTGDGSDQRYLLRAADGRYLARGSNGTALVTATAAAAAADPFSVWTLSTTDGRSFDVLNNGNTEVLDVNGASTAEGAGVDTWPANGGSNQAFALRALTPTGVSEVSLQTQPGVTPTLPRTVTPTYTWGTGPAVPVTWQTDGLRWDRPRVVTVTGTATDVFGRALPQVTARVAVGTFRATDPTSITVAAGTTVEQALAAAPTTVPGRVRELRTAYPTPVRWSAGDVTDADLATPGRVTFTGAADANPEGQTVPATLTVVVVAATTADVVRDADVVAAATFTEPGYSVAGTRNGDTTDKAWSNWLSGTKRSSDTLTYTFRTRTLTGGSVTFYRDGGSSSWAQSVALEYRDAADGRWVRGPAGDVTTTVPASGPIVVAADLPDVAATGLRFVLTANPASHMVVSEVGIEAQTLAPSTVADLAALRVDGTDVAGFDPATSTYTVDVADGAPTRVTAIDVDVAARVTVRQASAGSPEARVVVTAPDGVTRRTYTVRLV